MTLIEILVVVSIIALVSSGVAIAAMKYRAVAMEKTAKTSAGAVREAVKGYWITRDSASCPTTAELIAEGSLDEASPRTDPWGTPWRIDCDGTAVTVSSSGADRHAGTEDDIRVPPKTS